MKIEFINSKNESRYITSLTPNIFYQTKKMLNNQQEIHDCLIFRVSDILVYISDDGKIEYDNLENACVDGTMVNVHDKVTITVDN